MAATQMPMPTSALRGNGGHQHRPKIAKNCKGGLTATQNNRQIAIARKAPRTGRDNSGIDGRLRRNPQL
jgi:hypothetical protein